MLRKIEKIKHPADEPDFWQTNESTEQTSDETKTENIDIEESSAKQAEIHIENNSSLDRNDKLILVDLTKSDKEEIPKFRLDNDTGWNIIDGDYTGNTTMNEERSVRYRMAKKRFQKFSFIVTIAVLIIIVLGIASVLASSI